MGRRGQAVLQEVSYLRIALYFIRFDIIIYCLLDRCNKKFRCNIWPLVTKPNSNYVFRYINPQ